MSVIELLLLSVALAMDACAAAISEGVRMRRLRHRHALKVGLFFGAFQAVMPVVGYIAGITVDRYIESVDHWIAAGLLGFIGARMMVEAYKGDNAQPPPCADTRTLCVLSLATSIDALAVGVSLAIQHEDILRCALVIGAVTFLLCYLGVVVGRRLGRVFRRRAEIAGGLTLVMIGVNILLEHLLGH